MYAPIVLAATEGESSALQLFFFHSLSELIVTSLASIIVFALMFWKGVPAARAALESRTTKIATEIEHAGQARRSGEGRLVEVQQRIASAEDERQRILVEARQTAEALKQQIVAKATAEAEALSTRAAADAEAAKRQAIADLQAEVGELALQAAAVVVARNLDPDTQAELIDGYIEQVSTAPTGAERGNR
jgi:F-type H+-transporting ATPase subunit b